MNAELSTNASIKLHRSAEAVYDLSEEMSRSILQMHISGVVICVQYIKFSCPSLWPKTRKHFPSRA